MRYRKHIQNTLGTQTQHPGPGKNILQMRKLRPRAVNWWQTGTLSLNSHNSCPTHGFAEEQTKWELCWKDKQMDKQNPGPVHRLFPWWRLTIQGPKIWCWPPCQVTFLLIYFLTCTRRLTISKVSFTFKNMSLWPQFSVFQLGIIFSFPKCLRIVWNAETHSWVKLILPDTITHTSAAKRCIRAVGRSKGERNMLVPRLRRSRARGGVSGWAIGFIIPGTLLMKRDIFSVTEG